MLVIPFLGHLSMDIIYIADLDFIAKREIKSLPKFHGARFSAFLRFACKRANLKLEDCVYALLPFRSGTRHIHTGDHLRLRLLLTEYGKEKLPFLCNAIFSTDEQGEFSAESLQLVSVIDAVVNKNVNFIPNKGFDLTQFSFDYLKKEAEYLTKLDLFTFELISPLRLSLPPGCRVTNADDFEKLCKEDFFYNFEYALLHILNSLKHLGELEVDISDIEKLPKVVEGRTEWCDVRYSRSRQIPLGGIIGDIKYEGTLPSYELALRLVAGQYTGLGRNQRFGLGFYKIPELEIVRSICMPNSTRK